MTLPSSPPISAQEINVELGRNATAPFDINGSAERALAGVPSGAISFSNFLGKSAVGNYTFLGSYTQNTGSFTINLGPVFTGRSIVVALGWSGTSGNSISYASINGTTASIVQDSIYDTVAYSVGAAILTASPSGTSGTLSISVPNIVGVTASVWALKNATTVASAHKSASGLGLGGVSAPLSLQSASGGIIVEGGSYYTPGSPASNMWRGGVNGIAQSSGMPRLGTAASYGTGGFPSYQTGVSIGGTGNENDTLLAAAAAMTFSF